ncbi:MAG: hypothetical protein WC623_22435 [Pedobacter sp.]
MEEITLNESQESINRKFVKTINSLAERITELEAQAEKKENVRL